LDIHEDITELLNRGYIVHDADDMEPEAVVVILLHLGPFVA
jgi:hypothetical protein